jgi:hypothetical protein
MATVQQWIDQPGNAARATRRIYEADGSFVSRGSIGDICDYLPHETSEGGYVVVDFPGTGAVLCAPDEICPAEGAAA